MGYFKTQVSVFLNSWKRLGWNLIPIAAFDILAVAMIALIGMLFLTMAASKVSFLQNASNIQSLPLEEATKLAQDLKGFILFFVIAFFLLLLFSIAVWSFFKSLSWSVVADKSVNKKAGEKIQKLLARYGIGRAAAFAILGIASFVIIWLSIVTSNIYAWAALGVVSFIAVWIASQSFSLNHLKNFLIANLIWVFGWFAVLALLVTAVKQEAQIYLAMVLFPAIIHFSGVLYASIARRRTWRVFRETLVRGIRIHRFIIPWILMIGILLIYNLIWGVIVRDSGRFLLLNIIVLSLYLAWAKIYYSDVIEYAT
ncbi:hypothetical protein HY638_01970 [Candidatus Woesearchaeota archaeon]|nr:hypothetical protein [Candidatus Woesearchaeota archaeon]